MTEPDENGWMPIDTAPKDGTAILVYQPKYYSGPRMFVARWDSPSVTAGKPH